MESASVQASIVVKDRLSARRQKERAIMPPTMTTTRQRWDIFARVIDNFGDAGVSWRLARQLAAEHDVEVTLWLDHVAALVRIAPAIIADASEQCVQGVVVRQWLDPF